MFEVSSEMPSSVIVITTAMQSYWLLTLLPSATAFVPSVRPPTIPSTARPRAQPAHAFVLPPAAGIESFDQTVVGLTELLLFSGIVASYEISRTMQVHIRSGIYDPSSRRRRILATQPAIPYEKMWLAGASLPSVDELVQGCFKIAEDAAGCAHVTHLFYFTISLLTLSRVRTRSRMWFICANASGKDCEADEDFSAWYGRPIYVCEM